MHKSNYLSILIWVIIFSIAMAFAESAVVVYLRAIFYPDGFTFPLKAMADSKILIEVFREAATIFMLTAVACLAGKRPRERFAYFMLAFGIWDIFYYAWLKVLLDWPSSLLEWDVLFLIPLPWIGPVIAPVSISVLMMIFALLIIYSCSKNVHFKAAPASYILALTGTVLILYSFIYDTGATLHQHMPEPYRYDLLIIGDLLYIAAFTHSYWKRGHTI